MKFPIEDPYNCLVPEHLSAPISGSKAGPLAGLTFAAKDLFDVVGHKTSNGSPDFFKNTSRSNTNAAAITKLLDSGATLLGMTICDEFFYSLTGANAHYGTPINFKAPDRLPGGSSSGSAVAAAANMVDFSLGSDTGGSVRIPSSFCGIWGIRPTFGRVDPSGSRAMAPSFDTVGWFSSQPELMPLIGQVLLEGKTETAPIDNILIAEDAVNRADPEIQAAFNTYCKEILDKNIQRIILSSEGLDSWRETFRIIQAGEVKTTNLPWVRAHNASLGPGIKERFKSAEKITDKELKAAKKKHNEIRMKIHKLISPGTVIILPTAPCIAPLKNASSGALESFRSNTMALTCIAGLAGLPQISSPSLTVDGCPVGVSVIGSPQMDERILDLALRLSKRLRSQ